MCGYWGCADTVKLYQLPPDDNVTAKVIEVFLKKYFGRDISEAGLYVDAGCPVNADDIFAIRTFPHTDA